MLEPIADFIDSIDPNLEYLLYVNDKIVDSNNLTYTFQENGTYKFEVKTITVGVNGDEMLVTSGELNVNVRTITVLEQYGLYIMAGIGGLIVLFVILYFIRAKRRGKVVF